MSKRTDKYDSNIKEIYKGLISGDRTVLARAITLIESNSPGHQKKAQQLLLKLAKTKKKSIRIGVTGPPGVGKSTFIDTFGTFLCGLGKKVAVLAIDPSSSISKGSILGDKTRMENLSRNPEAFIRPSPSGGNLGGVAGKTRESIILCEAAGYDVIIVETIGVGQSEIAVRSMVDFFLLLLQPGGGDELQGFKKGSVELADCIAVNKADGDNLKLAEITLKAYQTAVHYLKTESEDWTTKLFAISSVENTGIELLWDTILDFIELTTSSGFFYDRRKSQLVNWTHSLIKEKLVGDFYNNNDVSNRLSIFLEEITSGKTTPINAVSNLFEIYKGKA